MSDEALLLETSRFRVVQIQQRLADGSVRERQVVRHPGAVVILPLVEEDHVCLIRNTRPAVGETLIELPAGTLEGTDSPRETALRELREETGYEAAELEPLHEFFLSPGILDERMYAYIARGLSCHEPQREPGELIENFVVMWDKAIQLAITGQIRDAKTLVTLLLYDAQRRTKP